MNTCTCPTPSEPVGVMAIGGMAAFYYQPLHVGSINPLCLIHGRNLVTPPQSLVDDIALAAQTYAGYLVGHPYRVTQFPALRKSTVDKSKPWREPASLPDDCIFCVRMSDEDVIRRIEGFQGQIDKEVLRAKSAHYYQWLQAKEGVPEPDGWSESDANRRAFVLLRQNVPTANRPKGWREKPFPLVDLPMRLKRKLCITWNHIYVDWMKEHGLEYDFDTRQFKRQTDSTAVQESVTDA